MSEQAAEAQRRQQQPGFEQMAKSIHGSYLRRWDRHDPQAVEASEPDADTSTRRPASRRVSAA